MEFIVNGGKTYCYTGGKPFEAAKPTVVFIHGVLNDHSVWGLQTRWFANQGFNVLAPDLPGHGRSEGEPPASVEAGAKFVLDLLDAAGVKSAALVGHSFGSLIAVETAGSQAQRVTHLAMIGTASPMKVSPALLDASLNHPMKAIDMVNIFSHSMLAPPPSALGPGTWLYGNSKALMKRVLASNPRVNVFHTGFKACDGYRGGEAAMANVTCPVLFILGKDDMMTMPRMARPLIDKAARGNVVLLKCGHQHMAEAPDGVLFALRDFIKP